MAKEPEKESKQQPSPPRDVNAVVNDLGAIFDATPSLAMPKIPQAVAASGVFSPPPVGGPKPKHSRGVSWDQNIPAAAAAAGMEPTTLSPKPPPILRNSSQESNDGARPPLGQRTTMRPPRPPQKVPQNVVQQGAPRRDSSVSDLGGEEFLSEEEAELLRTLDERNPMSVSSDAGKPILDGVPMDQLKHDFDPSGSEIRAPLHQPTLSLMSSGSHNSAPRSPPATPPRPRLFSNDTQKSRARLASNDFKPQGHRRQLTVEEALFGLTTALSAIKNEDERNNQVPLEMDIGSRERADTASDPLAATANILFKRIRKGTADIPKSPRSGATTDDQGAGTSPHPSSPTDKEVSSPPKSKWGLVREAIDHPKKSDDAQDLSEQPIKEEDEEMGETPTSVSEEHSGGQGGGDDADRKRRRWRIFGSRKRKPNPFKHLPYASHIKNEWELFTEFLKPKRSSIWTICRYVFMYLWLPALGIAALLYHFFDNPSTGKCTSKEFDEEDTTTASASWWILFVCIRQTFLFGLAKLMELIVVDFFALSSRAILRTFGPLFTLLVVQSKGWPCLMFFWGIWNFALVTGHFRISAHWLYWQDIWGLFNECNPAGDVTSRIWLYRVVIIATCVGLAVSVKRVFVSVLLGRGTFVNYSEKLTKVMQKMLQISEVSNLAKDIERRSEAKQSRLSRGFSYESSPNVNHDNKNDLMVSLIETANNEDAGEDVSTVMDRSKDDVNDGMGLVIDPEDIDPYTGSLRFSQKTRIAELLGRWEEPDRAGPSQLDTISISAVLQFKRALAHMDTNYPFSGAFGVADTRESCIMSAQHVYDRLMMKNDTINGMLHFDVIASLCVESGGELNQEKVKEYIRTFRPDRDGGVALVDFIRSVDKVYRELRMLRATVASSSKIDQAIEKIINILFYIVMLCIILSQTGFDPLALFLSLSSIILAFAFMIGSASAKYFEGLLLILVQRPYGIGDRINISNPQNDLGMGGAQGWIVDNVTLFTTTICLAGTNERATASNGSLAQSRIINGARSPKAICHITMRLDVSTPIHKIDTFKSAVEKFVKSRPRQWLAILGFRANNVGLDLNYVECGIVLQHREAWQNIGPILDSRQTLSQYCVELARKLEMGYRSPALPVDLRMTGQNTPQFEFKYDFEGGEPLTERRKSIGSYGQAKSVATEDLAAVNDMFAGR